MVGQDRGRLKSPAPPPGYDPQLYRLLHRGNAGDAEFYRRGCARARTVLELGCGYGRLLNALLPRRGGYVGVELDPGLLRLARAERARLSATERARVTLRRADMRDFRLAERFDRVVIPHSGLFCLASDADVLACLRCVRDHLAPAGELWFDTYAADSFHRLGDRDPAADRTWHWLAAVAEGAREYDVFERARWRRDAQRLSVRYRYVPRAGGPAREGRIEHRYLRSSQLPALLEAAGLRQLSRAGDFRGGAFRRNSELLVIRAALQR